MLGDIQDLDVRAPYVFDFPVCTWGNALKWSVTYTDLEPGRRPYHFPCGLRIGDDPTD